MSQLNPHLLYEIPVTLFILRPCDRPVRQESIKGLLLMQEESALLLLTLDFPVSLEQVVDPVFREHAAF